MPPKTILRILTALAAFASSAANAEPAATATGTAAPTPTKSEVLAAIAAIEKDPLGKQGLDAMSPVVAFMEDSNEVLCVLGPATMPWLFDGTKNLADETVADVATQILSASYFAGNIQAQLKNGKPLDDPRAGWLFVIRAYKQLAEKIKISSPSVERLSEFESRGWLVEYAAVVMRDSQESRTRRDVPDSKKLTRDYLAPARGLANQRKYPEAYALYNTWLAQNPYDAEVHFELGYAIDLQAGGENKKKAAAELIKKARPHVLMAAVLGSKDPLLPELLQTTAPNYDKTRDAPFSNNKKAADRIAQAEKAFAQHRYDDAAKLYQEALKHDPKSYVATLFTGDSYYASGNLPSAIEWFKKAVALDPNIETAHRYLADALRKSGKPDEALDEYIAALIAEPYARLPRMMLERVAQGVNPLYKTSPLRDIPMLDNEIDANGSTVSLVITPAKNSPMIVAYATARTNWVKSEGKNADWRQSAAEEAVGLRAFATTVFELNDKKDANASNWLAAAVAIKKLDEAGLLEAAIHLDRPTKDIARDYPAYREKHRDLLVRYLREFWLCQTS